jgi:hypothetical protein
MDEKRFKEIKEKVADLRQQRDKAEGAMDTIKKRLKNEFNCSSIDAAMEKKEELEKDIEASTKRLDSVLLKIEKAYDWDSLEVEEA